MLMKYSKISVVSWAATYDLKIVMDSGLILVVLNYWVPVFSPSLSYHGL